MFAFEEGTEVGAGGVGFDTALNFGEFAFGAAVFESFDAAFGFFPSELVRIFEKNFEQDAAVAAIEFGANLRGLHRFSCEDRGDESGEDFFGLEADVELSFVDLVGQFEAEAFSFGKHSNDAALGGFCGATDQFGLEFYLVAAFRGGFANFSAEDGFVEAKLLGDARGPFGTEEAIRNLLDVRQQKIYGVALPFSSAEVHAARAGNEVIDVGWRFFEEFDVGVFALLADEFVGVGFSGECENANFIILFKKERNAAFGGGLASGVGVVVDDDAMREAREEFYLWLGESGAATGDDVADAGAGDGDGVHVAFDKDGEIGAAEGVFCAIEVIKHVALGIDRSFRGVEIFGLVVAESTATEGDDFSGFVGDRKSDAAAETVEEAASVLIARN